MHRIAIVAVLAAGIAAGCAAAAPDVPARLYDVAVESGKREVGADRIGYALYVPRPNDVLPRPPWPAVILTHGFARDHTFHSANARYMAARGIVVLTPDMLSLMGGEAARTRNVALLADHAAWLAARAAATGDSLAGVIDPRRIGLAGHSAGGAVSFEAAVETQKSAAPVAALCLLDAVPWPKTLREAADLKPLAFASLRSEPADWNARGRVLELLGRMAPPVEDVRIVGARHCDPENPTDVLGPLFTGGSTKEGQRLYQRLMYLFFKDALGAPAVEGEAETYRAALAGLQAAGSVALATVRPAGAPAYANPIYFQGRTGKDEVRDPCIVREGDTYYLVFTVWPFRGRDEKHLADPDNGSSPGIRLFSSKDLINWKFEKWLVKSSELPQDCPYKHRFWAPEIHRMGGRFYLIFTADNWLEKRHNPAGSWGAAGYAFVGVADRVTGPYEHITYIPGGACDTSLFEDSDGQTYAFIPAGDVFVQRIDLTRLAEGKAELVGRRTKVVTADNGDIDLAERPTYLEGPWAVKRGGKYLLFFAGPYKDQQGRDAGYRAGVAYADNVMGPYKKDPRGKVFWGGHLAVFDGPDGRLWFSYRGEQHRETRGFLCIDPFDIDAAGRVQPQGPSLPQTPPPSGP